MWPDFKNAKARNLVEAVVWILEKVIPYQGDRERRKWALGAASTDYSAACFSVNPNEAHAKQLSLAIMTATRGIQEITKII